MTYSKEETDDFIAAIEKGIHRFRQAKGYDAVMKKELKITLKNGSFYGYDIREVEKVEIVEIIYNGRITEEDM